MTTEEELKLLKLTINATLDYEIHQEAKTEISKSGRNSGRTEILEDIEIKYIKYGKKYVDTLPENIEGAEDKSNAIFIVHPNLTTNNLAHNNEVEFTIKELAEVLAPLKSEKANGTGLNLDFTAFTETIEQRKPASSTDNNSQEIEHTNFTTNNSADNNSVKFTIDELDEVLASLKSEKANGTGLNLDFTAFTETIEQRKPASSTDNNSQEIEHTNFTTNNSADNNSVKFTIDELAEVLASLKSYNSQNNEEIGVKFPDTEFSDYKETDLKIKNLQKAKPAKRKAQKKARYKIRP